MRTGLWSEGSDLQETDLSEEGEGNHRKECEEKGHRYFFIFAGGLGRVGACWATLCLRHWGLHFYF